MSKIIKFCTQFVFFLNKCVCFNLQNNGTNYRLNFISGLKSQYLKL